MEEKRLDVTEEWKKDLKVKVWYALRNAWKSIIMARGEILDTDYERVRGEILGKMYLMQRLIDRMIDEYSDDLYENYEINTEVLLKDELSKIDNLERR